MAKTPMDIMLEGVDWRCGKCKAKMGNCDCWRKCPVPGCTWSIEKGHKCRNPDHKKKKANP